MLYRVTTGNVFKKLKSMIEVDNCVLSLNLISINNKLILPNFNLNFDCLNIIATSDSYCHTKSKYLFKYLISSLIIVWARIIFRGKGFRIRNFQSERKLTFNFGHSHWTKLKVIKYWFFWKIKRQSYVIVSLKNKNLETFKLFFPSIKLVNKYTKRGLRLKRQSLVKRFGKISQYVSSLH